MAKYSQRQRIIQYVRDTFGTEAEYLWADTPNFAVLRHSATKKWYAIAMDLPANRLGLEGREVVDVMNVKCSTMMIGLLLSEAGFFPAYHMNKDHWISILLDGSVPDDQIFPLLEMSYDSVAPKRRKGRIQPAGE